MFILIKDVHLVGIKMMYVAHINVYVQHTSMRKFNRTYIRLCPIYQYVSSTAHILLCGRPTHQYASVQPHIHMFMSNIPLCQFNCPYTPICTSNTPVRVSSTEYTCTSSTFKFNCKPSETSRFHAN